MKTLIKGAKIINEGKVFLGSVSITDDVISSISEGSVQINDVFDEVIDASGCYLLPGIIDEHVHFREPGLTNKADISTESRAAAYGGVTSFFDMPNTVPQTTTEESLENKFNIAKLKSSVNYSFFIGATNENTSIFSFLNPHRIPGIKLFMGASTGNMLVDRKAALETIFSSATIPVMTHCEDSNIISENIKKAKLLYGQDPSIEHHEQIRSEDACYESTKLAVTLAKKYSARLHVAHISTEKELQLFGDNSSITAEAVIGHLFFSDTDYHEKGSLIKCNPSIKKLSDREAIRNALINGRISTVATDHAPHLLEEKQGGCLMAASGMPMVQFSLPAMLELKDKGVLTLERLVTLMCHNPARIFEVSRRGFIRNGYKADITIVRPNCPWKVTQNIIQSKCKWSPFEGHTFKWRVEYTFCNGHKVFSNSHFDDLYRGEEIQFRTE
jgi:dihydroorotase